ncbi:MAG: hypothetical protein AAGA71_21690 [Pseudomonadota bacterium]
MRHSLRTLLAALGLFLAAISSAQALPVTWTLEDAEFRFGGTATGGFVHDFLSNTFSVVNIVTTPGAAAGSTDGFGATYSFSLSGAPSTQLTFLEESATSTDLTGDNVLFLLLDELLTPFGGTIDLAASSGEVICDDQDCIPPNPNRVFAGGSLVGVQVIPLPASAMLLLSALGGLGLLVRRRA